VSWLLRDVEVAGARTDCRIDGDRIVACAPGLTVTPSDKVIDGRGGRLLPGLADHHIHLMATAAAAASVDVSAGLDALRSAPAGGWVRAVGARHELIRADIDAVESERPVRVQHRGGSLWTLNSLGVEAVRAHLTDEEARTGQLWRADRRLRLALRTEIAAADLAALGRRLVEYGITHVTDATPDLEDGTLQRLRDSLPQHISALAPGKIVVADHHLPTPDALADRIAAHHHDDRAVALHCVSAPALALAITTLSTVGSRPGDRIEHAAVCDDAAAARLAELGVIVVTQPSLVARHGDDYRAGTEAAELPYLWRYAGLRAAGVAVVASSDAPYGDLNPWCTVAAAADRTTPSGVVLGPGERVPADTALRSFLTNPDDPSGPERAVAAGEAADLCLLTPAGAVRAVFIAGQPQSLST
jgi:predicted amidohydrolase YtcJ